MCGVVGYIGRKNVTKELLESLKLLEYRGYDSAGISYIKNNKIEIVKCAGKINNLENKIERLEDVVCGIGHTRWATHGKANDANAHPHISCSGKWSIVHNGIIENYATLKKDLVKNTNIQFLSETDSEVIAQLLDVYDCSDKLTTLIRVCELLDGAYALACINNECNGQIFLAKNKSPLYVAKNNNEVYVASDPICFEGKCSEYYSLEDNEFCCINGTTIEFYDNKHNRIAKNTTCISFTEESEDKTIYPHCMLKEILETKDVLKNIVDIYTKNKPLQKLDKEFLKRFKKIIFIGCGSAYHAGLMGEKFLIKFPKLDCHTYVASEYRYLNDVIDKSTLFIFISQSGETADTLACLDLAKKFGATTIGLTNVLYSTLAKGVDYILPVFAGREVAVGSTKAYTAMITVLYMLAIHFDNELHNKKKNVFTEIVKLAKEVEYVEYNYSDIVNLLIKEKNIFLIGRDVDYVTITEGSLKLKEITYINASAYPAGELKHGFLALIEEGSFVFVLATQKRLLEKTLNGASEAFSRGGKIILITQLDLPEEKLSMVYKVVKLKNFDENLMPVISVMFFQMLSYLVGVKKGIDPDKPRNLAKSVTVE